MYIYLFVKGFIMTSEYDWDIYEIFREQIELQIPKIESNILLLNDKQHLDDSINELFRTYHSYKATSSYLSLIPLNNLVNRVEIILSSLRMEQKIVQDSIIEWLLQTKDQLNIWLEEMQTNETILTSTPKYLCNKVKISKSYISTKDRMKTLTILYIDDNKSRSSKITSFLKQMSKEVKSSNDLQEAENLIDFFKYDILILNLSKGNHALIDICKKSHKNTPIIAIFDKISSICGKKLLKNGINHAITNPLSSKIIQRELALTIKSYFSSTNILIDNKKIADFIQTLKPLPNTIFQIMQVCDDDEVPIKELITIVKKDPIIAGNILNAANSPLYGSSELKTIDQAVSRLGKRAIKALTMSGIYKNLGKVDLSPYNINEDIFSKVSMMRLSLMLKWYAKVSISDLSILSSTALLGNIGQLLISKELIDIHQDDIFKELSFGFDTKYAEEAILHTTTTIISTQILNYWKLSPEIVDVVSYSDNPLESPIELRKLAIANYIVYNLIQIDGTVLDEIPDNILTLVAEYNFDLAVLKNALEKTIKSVK